MRENIVGGGWDGEEIDGVDGIERRLMGWMELKGD